MTEPTLFPVEPVTVKLTERQAFVLDALRAQPEDGLDADEVGARLHERRGKHDGGVRCSWCAPDGVGVLKALRKKGLVKRRRGGTWIALSEPESAESSQDGPGDLPEGF